MPTAGVRDWLRRHLARRRGVTANVDFPFPNRFTSMALGLDPASRRRRRSVVGCPSDVGPGRRARPRRGQRARLELGHAERPTPSVRRGPPHRRPLRPVRHQPAQRAGAVGGWHTRGRHGERRPRAGRPARRLDDVAVRALRRRARAHRRGPPRRAPRAAAGRPAGRAARAGGPGARRTVRHQRPLGGPARRARRPRHGPRCRRVRGVPVAGLLGALPAARPATPGRPPARRRRRRRPRRTSPRALVGAFGARDSRPRPRPRRRGRRRAAAPTTSRHRPPCCATSRATSSRTARPPRSPARPTAPCRCTRAMARCASSTPSATPSTPASSPIGRSNRETCS